MISFPFGIGKGCYLEKSYEIECVYSSTSKKSVPFLSKIGMELVENISFPYENTNASSMGPFGLVRARIPIISVGCSGDGKKSGSGLDLRGSPFYIDGGRNNLIAVGCNHKVSLTNVEPNMVGCQLNCTMSKGSLSNNIPFFDKTGCSSSLMPYSYRQDCIENKPEETSCNGNGCCEASLPSEGLQVFGVKIERNDGKLMTKEECTVAFLTDEVYTLSNAINPERVLSKRYATVSLGWVIQAHSLSFFNLLGCKTRKEFDETSSYSTARRIKCICQNSTISGINYGNCDCNSGYTGNPYILGGCQDIDECADKSENNCRERDICVNVPGGYDCIGDKTKPIAIGLSAGFGVLLLVGGIWWLRKFLIKRRVTKRKRKFFKRNGGLLLQQELNTREGNVEKTKIFSSRELEKATENFSVNRVLGQGGQGTVYKGMLIDGRTVAVKKSKVVDEDKLQEFINEVVILSQINHRHVVQLLGCCLETEVPVLVYEFIPNGNLFQHIHEEFEDYTMIWGVRLRIAVDIAGALSYLHSAACSPIYHRDVKSTNILLDEKYRAKVSDFGTSRSVTIDQTHWTTLISGTVGYVDPEYYKSSQYTEKSDVYSFGVILSELITGEKPVITLSNTQGSMSLVEHFRTAMKENRFLDIVDTRIRDDCKQEQVMAVANLAMKCLSSKGKNRPNMREVFTELERILTSPEDSKLQIQIDEVNDDDEDDEEEDMKIINRSDSWRIGVTAPVSTIVASSSSLEVEPLFPRLTW